MSTTTETETIDNVPEFNKIVARRKELNLKYPEITELIRMEIAFDIVYRSRENK